MEDERHVLPGGPADLRELRHVLRSKPWVQACASSLTELFAPRIHQERIEAFPLHYPWIPPEALDYFKSRLVQAPRDVQHGLSIVQAHCTTVETQQRGLRALAFKLECCGR